MMHDDQLKKQSKKEDKDFTRNRKLGFIPMICLIFNMIRKSTQLELDEFRERFMPESALTTTYSKQAFSEARQKLSPKAFVLLNDGFIQQFYADDDYKTYKGFRLLAIDGMVTEIPNNKKTRKHYGFVTNGEKKFKLARALSSQLLDIENKLVLSSTLGRYDASERDLAIINIEKLLSWETPYSRDLLLCDRGYPSAAFIHYLQTRKIHFLMRASTRIYKEVLNTTTPDEMVEMVITKRRAKDLKQNGTPIAEGTVLKVRVIKVELSTGEIETHTVIEQDFYATILLSNMASIIEQDAHEEMQKKNAHKTLKYDNHNILVGKLKNRLVEILLEDDDAKKDAMFQRLIAELERHIVPVIPGRRFTHEKKSIANKYSKSKRRSL